MPTEIDDALLEVLTDKVRRGLGEVREVTRASGRDPAQVTIIAVTKGWGPEAPLAALANGLCWFGENYADELVQKASAVREVLDRTYLGSEPVTPPRWTFQGKLQSNKINRLKGVVELWQTVDSVDRAKALGARVPGASVLIQVVLEDSGSRSGCDVSEVPQTLQAARAAGLDVQGLMGVGPNIDLYGTEATLEAFARLQQLGRVHELNTLSMGMSDDYGLALSCGATHLRLGSVLFGPRTEQ